MRRSACSIASSLLGALLIGAPAAAQQPDDGAIDLTATPARIESLASAAQAERDAIARMLASDSWAEQAIAAMRLERYGCAASRALFDPLLNSASWQLRVFALRSLAARGDSVPAEWISAQTEPRVIRAVARCGGAIEPALLQRGVTFLLDDADPDRRLLGVEIAAASDAESLRTPAVETFKSIVARLERRDAGALSPRLAALLGAPDFRRTVAWQSHLRRLRGDLRLRSLRVDGGGDRPGPSGIARLRGEQFALLRDYLDDLHTRQLDLAICMDCTASMWGEIAQCQGDVDDLMSFLAGVLRSARIGIVAYRDRRSPGFETRWWDFTSDLGVARDRLWQLSAEGGGDRPEMVLDGLRAAYGQLDWQREHRRVVVLIGDAPPHTSEAGECIRLAELAAATELTTHVIEAVRPRDDGKSPEPVAFLAQIAAAGGGRCVQLDQERSLAAELAGLTVGERFRGELDEFFARYLELCR